MGLTQLVYALPSMEHSNDPDSVEINTKSALVKFVGLAGPLMILVSGGVVSILQL